jgi:cobalt-zinc-cadmium efflux system protein
MSLHRFQRHEHGDAKTAHCRQQHQQRVLLWGLLLTLSFAVIGTVGGWVAHSLALISDACHMFTDSAALGFAWLAQIIARYPPSTRYSFGFGRAEALSAFVNCVVMLGVVAWIVFAAVQRFYKPTAVQADLVIWVAVVGLCVNLLVAWVLSRDPSSINSRAALLHVWGDLLGSLAALASGIGTHYTGWVALDPILSIFVSLLILKSTRSVLRDVCHFLMNGVPKHIDYEQVGLSLAEVDGVVSIHDLHIWDMTPGEAALIGHVVVQEMKRWPGILEAIRSLLRAKYAIDHITLQPELPRAIRGT